MKTATNIKIYRHAGDVAVTLDFVTHYISQEQAAWLSNQLRRAIVDIEHYSSERSRFKPAEYLGYTPTSARVWKSVEEAANACLKAHDPVACLRRIVDENLTASEPGFCAELIDWVFAELPAPTGHRPAPLTEQKQRLINIYLDWVNNFLTVEAFAEHYGLQVAAARTVIETGRNLHNSNLKSLQ